MHLKLFKNPIIWSNIFIYSQLASEGFNMHPVFEGTLLYHFSVAYLTNLSFGLHEWQDFAPFKTCCFQKDENTIFDPSVPISGFTTFNDENVFSDDGISIPSSYTSYVCPTQSHKIYARIAEFVDRDKPPYHKFEQPYVVHLQTVYQIAPVQSLFTFVHPNKGRYHR